MIVFSTLAAIAAASSNLLSFATATPISPEESIHTRQDSYYILQPLTDGGVQPRLEIREMERNPAYREVWALFLLAVERLKVTDQQSKTSFYGIAGRFPYHVSTLKASGIRQCLTLRDDLEITVTNLPPQVYMAGRLSLGTVYLPGPPDGKHNMGTALMGNVH